MTTKPKIGLPPLDGAVQVAVALFLASAVAKPMAGVPGNVGATGGLTIIGLFDASQYSRKFGDPVPADNTTFAVAEFRSKTAI